MVIFSPAKGRSKGKQENMIVVPPVILKVYNFPRQPLNVYIVHVPHDHKYIILKLQNLFTCSLYVQVKPVQVHFVSDVKT